MLFGDMLEGKKSEISLTDPNISAPAFLKFLEFLYTGKTTFDPETALPLLYISKIYGVSELEFFSRGFITGIAEVGNAMNLWSSAIELQEDPISEKCKKIFALRSRECLADENSGTWPDYFVREILSQDYATVTEFELFLFLEKWAHMQDKKEWPELFSLIRYFATFNFNFFFHLCF
jgi:hypothetical protein